MKKKATSGEKKPEEMRKRLKNSLPWSLSRWIRKIFPRISEKGGEIKVI
ncbi:MAG: hypothetical protein M0Q43_03100 [Methanothrix sp.]|nr:hypothetical protein [Methanothrix sp.]